MPPKRKKAETLPDKTVSKHSRKKKEDPAPPPDTTKSKHGCKKKEDPSIVATS